MKNYKALIFSLFVLINPAQSEEKISREQNSRINSLIESIKSENLNSREKELYGLIPRIDGEIVADLKKKSTPRSNLVLGLIYSLNNPLTENSVTWPKGTKAYDRMMIDRGPITNAVKQDFEKSIKYLKLASAHGELLADTLLGELYYEGKGTPTSFRLAKDHNQKAANAGHTRAKVNLMQLKFNDGDISPEGLKSMLDELIGSAIAKPGSLP